MRAAVPPPGEARPDYEAAVEFAWKLGDALGRDGRGLFPYSCAEDVFNEHRESTRGRDLDITGLSYALLDAGPQQWPLPEGARAGTSRLYEDGVFATGDGKAHFYHAPYRPVAEPINAQFPLHLNTGRLRDQWHGMSRTGLVPRLYAHVEEPLLSMNSRDMERRQLRDGDLVRVKNRRGSLVVKVQASEELRGGQVFMPMHWGGRFMAGMGVNALTLDACDPVSRQPELKHAAVQVEKAGLGYRRTIMRRGDGAELLRTAQAFIGRFDYATASLTGRDNCVLVFETANEGPLPLALVLEMDAAFGLDDPLLTMNYQDARRGIWKKVRVDDGVITGARLSGETAARDWIKRLIAEGASAMEVRNWLLAPVEQPPEGKAGRGHVICNCLNVAEPDIVAAIVAGADLAALQGTLKCGTECGSCVPELKRLIAGNRVAA
jgi:assimilatory nitrate reductase catalytic subunit